MKIYIFDIQLKKTKKYMKKKCFNTTLTEI